MALIAVTAATGAPGATVTSLALTLAWPRTALLAECDPAGGSVLSGYLAGQLPADRGLTGLAVADYHGQLIEDFANNLLWLDEDSPQRLLLPGVSEPTQAAALANTWPRLAPYLRQLELSEPPVDVVADCGRVPALHGPTPVLRNADVTLLVVGRTLSAVAAAQSRVKMLKETVEPGGVLRLVVRGRGEYDAREIAKRLDTRVLVELPEDPKSAAVLSNGGSGLPRGSALLRAARSAGEELQKLIEQRRTVLGGQEPHRPAVARPDVSGFAPAPREATARVH